MKESKDSQRVLPKRSGGRTNFSAKLQRFIKRSSAAQRALLAVMLVAVIGAAGGIGYLATNAATTASDGEVWTTSDDLWDYCWDWEHDYQVTIVAYNGTDTDITFPSSVTHLDGVSYTVVAVDLLHDGSEFFPNVGRANVTSMTFPSSYTSIGNCDLSEDSNARLNVDSTASNGGVFSNMTSLEEVTLYGNVSDYAFYGCTSLKSVVINYGCTNIGIYAFQNCTSLVNITLPSSLKSIEYSAFSGDTSLTKIIIPSSVTSIGTGVFYNCTALETVSLSKNVTTIDASTFYNCTSLKSIDLSNVTTLGSSAFSGCSSLTDIDLSNVTSVSTYAFLNCTSLTSSDIAGLVANLTTIPSNLFRGCTGLTSVDLSNVTTIESYAFYGCTGLTSVDLSSATTISNYAFYGCTGLTSVDLYDVTLSDYAFGNCTNLKTVNMKGATVTSNRSFYGCSGLATINITGAANIANYTFWSSSTYFTTTKSLTTLYIAEGAGATINSYAFYSQTNLSDVTLTGATYVGSYAFRDCTSLKEANLPDATTVGSTAFYNCTSLTTVNIPQITTINSYDFYNCTSLTTVNAPNVTYVGDCAFSYCTSFTTTTIDFTKVYYYGDYAFDGCSSLSIGDIVMTYTSNMAIGYRAFYNCDDVTSVTVTKPYGNITLGNYAFACCDNITEATFNGYIYVSSGSSSKLAQFVFYNCTSLEKVTFGPYCSAFLATSSGTYYRYPFQSFFSGCTSITDVYFYTTNLPYTYYNSEADLASGTVSTRTTNYYSYSLYKFLDFSSASQTVTVHYSPNYTTGTYNLYTILSKYVNDSSYNYTLSADLGSTELELTTTAYGGTLSAQTVYPSGSYTYTYNDNDVTASYSYPVAFFYEESPTMSCPWSYSDGTTISSSNTAFATTNSSAATVSSSGAVTVGAGTGTVTAYTLRSDITTDKAIQTLNTVVMDKATIYATGVYSMSTGSTNTTYYGGRTYDNSGTASTGYFYFKNNVNFTYEGSSDSQYFWFYPYISPVGAVSPTVTVTLKADDGNEYDLTTYLNYTSDNTSSNYTTYAYNITYVPTDSSGNYLTGEVVFTITIETEDGEVSYTNTELAEAGTIYSGYTHFYIVDASTAEYGASGVGYTSTSDNNVVTGTSGESTTAYYLATARNSSGLYYGDYKIGYTSANGTEYQVVQDPSTGKQYLVDPNKNTNSALDLESLGLSDTYAGTVSWSEVSGLGYGAVYEDEAAMYVCSYVLYGDTTGGASLELVKSDDSSISSKNMSQYTVNGITYTPSVDVAAVTFSEDAVSGSVTLLAYLPNGCTSTKTIYYTAPSTSSDDDDDDDDSTSYIDGGRPDSSDDEDEVWASSVSFANSSVTLYVGQTYNNAATVTPASNNDELYYFSYNSNIVTIDSETGKLTAVSTGETKVGVSTSSGLYATAAVTVVSADEAVSATAISATVSSSPVEVGDVVSLKTTLTPSDATVTLSYASSDTSVATVSSSGNITAVGIGTTTITVTATNKDGTTVKTTYKLTVSSNATKVSATVASSTIYVGGTTTISTSLTPSDATATLSYSSSNTSVATVSSSGKITAKAAGTATITVTATNTDGSKVTTTCKITVSEVPVTSIKLNKTSATVTSGNTLTLTATVNPSTASVTWSTSNSKIATVSSSGKVTTVGYGSVTITAKAGSKTATCTIFVEPDLDFTILGGSVRVSDPYGIRFGIQLGKTGDYGDVTIVEYGTLILPTEKLGSSELTTSTDSVLKVVGEKIYSETSSALVYTGVLINIPTSYFDTAISGRGYLIYKDTNGTQHTIYTDTVSRTFNGVAQSAYNSYVKISNPTTEQTAILNKLKELLNK